MINSADVADDEDLGSHQSAREEQTPRISMDGHNEGVCDIYCTIIRFT